MPKQTSRSDALDDKGSTENAFGVAVPLLCGPTASFGPAAAASAAKALLDTATQIRAGIPYELSR